MLVTAVGTDNSGCSALVVAEAQREVSDWHVLNSCFRGQTGSKGKNSQNH